MSSPPCKMSVDLNNLFEREIERKDDSVLRILQSATGDVGCVVWDAALVLAKYLESADFEHGRYWQGKSVLELGAGTGVVGLMAGSYGAQCTITDLPEFTPLMELNIEANRGLYGENVQARALRWGEDSVDTTPDVILIADCVYYKKALEPLVVSVDTLSGADTTVYCCYEERMTGNKPELQKEFFELVQRKFIITEVPIENQDEHFRSNDIHIMKFRKRPD